MGKIKALEKLRESSHLDDSKWTLDSGEVVHVFGSDMGYNDAINWGEQWRKIADEIEAEIAERFMELPVDADGVPIRVGDMVQFVNDAGGTGAKVEVCAVSNYYAYYGEGKHFYRAKNCRHVKPRTLEDVLHDFAHKAVRIGMKGGVPSDVELYADEDAVADFADEIRDLLGGDAE